MKIKVNSKHRSYFYQQRNKQTNLKIDIRAHLIEPSSFQLDYGQMCFDERICLIQNLNFKIDMSLF